MSNAQKPTETIELTPEDIADISTLNEPAAEYHTLLEVWREVLAPARDEATKKVTPQWASRICTQYPQIKFQELTIYRDLYFTRIEELRNILLLEIESDSEALTHTSLEDDREYNRDHYLNLLMLWQLTVQQWELDWECSHVDASVDLAAISEVHKMFFGDMGLIAHLEQIAFEFTEDDQQVLSDALNEHRAGEDE